MFFISFSPFLFSTGFHNKVLNEQLDEREILEWFYMFVSGKELTEDFVLFYRVLDLC